MFGPAFGLTDHHPLTHKLRRAGHRNDERDRMASLAGIEHLYCRLHGREWRVPRARHRPEKLVIGLEGGGDIHRGSDVGTHPCRRCR